ncbi:MAG: hypothetical protein ACJ76I_11165 [Gaiellaceae bacterium]
MTKPVQLDVQERWKDDADEHDYPAARDYLSLLFSDSEAEGLVERLRAGSLISRKAKDVLRASRLELLPVTDPGVVKDLTKIAQARKLSPVLLVRVGRGAPMIVADGYHRICASYHLDENAVIPCRVADTN